MITERERCRESVITKREMQRKCDNRERERERERRGRDAVKV